MLTIYRTLRWLGFSRWGPRENFGKSTVRLSNREYSTVDLLDVDAPVLDGLALIIDPNGHWSLFSLRRPQPRSVIPTA